MVNFSKMQRTVTNQQEQEKKPQKPTGDTNWKYEERLTHPQS